MDDNLSKLLVDVIKEPPTGPVHKSFYAQAILTIKDLLASDDAIVDLLSYDDNGTDTDLYPIRKIQIKNLRDCLLDRVNCHGPDLLEFPPCTISDVLAFVCLRPPSAVIPRVASATPAQLFLAKHKLRYLERKHTSDLDADNNADADEDDVAANGDMEAEDDVENESQGRNRSCRRRRR